MGCGTVYMTSSMPDRVTKTVLKIADRYRHICITPLGIPVEWPEMSNKKDFNEFVVYESI